MRRVQGRSAPVGDERKLGIQRRGWEEFSEAGMLWWINRLLHTFGWSIVLEKDENGHIVGVFPARTSWLGFDEDTDDEMLNAFQRHVVIGGIEEAFPDRLTDYDLCPHEGCSECDENEDYDRKHELNGRYDATVPEADEDPDHSER